ncbi:unnamed protein product [Cutaneotrichosporon oleaginosum]
MSWILSYITLTALKPGVRYILPPPNDAATTFTTTATTAACLDYNFVVRDVAGRTIDTESVIGSGILRGVIVPTLTCPVVIGVTMGFATANAIGLAPRVGVTVNGRSWSPIAVPITVFMPVPVPFTDEGPVSVSISSSGTDANPVPVSVFNYRPTDILFAFPSVVFGFNDAVFHPLPPLFTATAPARYAFDIILRNRCTRVQVDRRMLGRFRSALLSHTLDLFLGVDGAQEDFLQKWNNAVASMAPTFERADAAEYDQVCLVIDNLVTLANAFLMQYISDNPRLRWAQANGPHLYILGGNGLLIWTNRGADTGWMRLVATLGLRPFTWYHSYRSTPYILSDELNDVIAYIFWTMHTYCLFHLIITSGVETVVVAMQPAELRISTLSPPHISLLTLMVAVPTYPPTREIRSMSFVDLRLFGFQTRMGSPFPSWSENRAQRPRTPSPNRSNGSELGRVPMEVPGQVPQVPPAGEVAQSPASEMVQDPVPAANLAADEGEQRPTGQVPHTPANGDVAQPPGAEIVQTPPSAVRLAADEFEGLPGNEVAQFPMPVEETLSVAHRGERQSPSPPASPESSAPTSLAQLVALLMSPTMEPVASEALRSPRTPPPRTLPFPALPPLTPPPHTLPNLPRSRSISPGISTRRTTPSTPTLPSIEEDECVRSNDEGNAEDEAMRAPLRPPPASPGRPLEARTNKRPRASSTPPSLRAVIKRTREAHPPVTWSIPFVSPSSLPLTQYSSLTLGIGAYLDPSELLYTAHMASFGTSLAAEAEQHLHLTLTALRERALWHTYDAEMPAGTPGPARNVPVTVKLFSPDLSDAEAEAEAEKEAARAISSEAFVGFFKSTNGVRVFALVEVDLEHLEFCDV